MKDPRVKVFCLDKKAAYKGFMSSKAENGAHCKNFVRSLIPCLSIFLLILPACSYAPHITYTAKSSVEQLLVAKAIDRAFQGVNMNVKGMKICVDVASLMPDQEHYISKALSHWLLKNGSHLTEQRKEADAIASVLVKSAGTVGNHFNLGLPSLTVPPTYITTPQISFMSLYTQKGYVEMEIVLHGPESGLKEKASPLVGNSYFNRYFILFIPISTKDIN